MKKIHIVLIIVIALMAGTIVAFSFSTNTFGTFADAAQNPDMDCKVVGTLDKTQTLVYDPELNPNECSFYLLDKKGVSRKVVLHQVKPHDLEKSTPADEIVVTGSFINNEFHVKPDNIQLKCPSKYNKAGPMAEK
ncbi:MAG: cytochrome c maturation protein CcmE [Bacteroidia bacterium]|nr:cytochrome c maturation protein CcmE [Bacteroidia bacterium]